MCRFPRSIIHILGAITFLALAKPFGGIRSIVVGEVFYCLVNIALWFQLRNVFSFHMLPHQFGVVIRGECKAMVHGIWITLNIHPNWVVLQVDVANAFNFISCEAIFQKLHVAGGQLSLLFHFVHINFLCSLAIIPLKENCLLSFHPWACIKATFSLGLFLLLFIFVFCEPLLLFFLLVSSLCWQMTLTSSALPLSFLSLLTILLSSSP